MPGIDIANAQFTLSVLRIADNTGNGGIGVLHGAQCFKNMTTLMTNIFIGRHKVLGRQNMGNILAQNEESEH
ncbi:hypothetical protein SDC9_111472 [bioreactor metagenome]|uniref:Uncharacterized protein n=1 Tax=bioreactor metagenome TaxID=1076179 RepID=A0A645BGT3_9ZZZZ